jgi:hypothetical protein
MANKNFTFTGIRILYPAILRSKPNFSGNGEEYSYVMLVPKSDRIQLKRFKDAYLTLIHAEFKNKPAGIRPAIGLPHEKAVLKDGDAKYKATDIDRRPNYKPYKGHYYCTLAMSVDMGKIEAFDAEKQPILSQEQLPSGSYGNVVVELSAYRSPKYGPQFTIRPVIVQVIDISDPVGPARLSAEDALKLLPDNIPEPDWDEEDELPF